PGDVEHQRVDAEVDEVADGADGAEAPELHPVRPAPKRTGGADARTGDGGGEPGGGALHRPSEGTSEARSANGQRISKPSQPPGCSRSTSTPSTCACTGPRRHHSIMNSTRSGAPS